ncbi:MAG: hypothetical protein HYX94_03410 [Chloroflexi bacterium]|nr:hypothetical protein [Chloroflexota bacterium]
MPTSDWRAEHPALIQVLKGRLHGKTNCPELIDSFEVFVSSVWKFTALLLGEGGAKAVAGRSIQLTAANAPLLKWIQVRQGAVDFAELRAQPPESCRPPELMDAFLRLSVRIFQTLAELSGDAITGPLLSRLKEKP